MGVGRIIVVTGPPGAGKTTVSRLVAESFDRGVHLLVDELFRSIAAGFVEPWEPESHAQNETVVRAWAASAATFARGGYTVVCDGILGPWFLPTFVDGVWDAADEIDYVVLRPDADTCVGRALAREGVELTDEAAVRFMHGQFADLGWWERHVVDLPLEESVRRIVHERHPLVEIIGPPETDKLVLADPDPTWPARFEQERLRIVAALPTAAVEHVGSTAVAGLPAKPIIDVQVSVDDVEDEDAYLPALATAGYHLRVREPCHRMLRTADRDVHVHICGHGSDWERRHLAFRDHLRSHPDDRDLYADVKRRLLRQEWPSMDAYASAKSAVIAAITVRIPSG